MRLCTLALGERHRQLSRRLEESLPVEIMICTEIPPGFAKTRGDGRHDYHHKRFVIEKCYHPGGTLFLDADAVCTDHAEFLAFLDSLASLPPGIYSPYVFSCYGFKHPNLPDKRPDKTRLTDILRFVDSVIPLSDEEMLAFKMPYEWLMFFRFASPEQNASFFRRYQQLHDILTLSACALDRDCNLIGLSALHCKLAVSELPYTKGIRHKK